MLIEAPVSRTIAQKSLISCDLDIQLLLNPAERSPTFEGSVVEGSSSRNLATSPHLSSLSFSGILWGAWWMTSQSTPCFFISTSSHTSWCCFHQNHPRKSTSWTSVLASSKSDCASWMFLRDKKDSEPIWSSWLVFPFVAPLSGSFSWDCRKNGIASAWLWNKEMLRSFMMDLGLVNAAAVNLENVPKSLFHFAAQISEDVDCP